MDTTLNKLREYILFFSYAWLLLLCSTLSLKLNSGRSVLAASSVIIIFIVEACFSTGNAS